MMRWNDLLAGLEQAKLRYDRHGAANPEIHAITDDSRQVAPGSVFVAYKGVAVDGHRFIPDALRRGAAAIVVERPSADPAGAPSIVVNSGREALAWLCAAWRGFPGRALRVVGVTGTDGKTTTCNLAYAILTAAKRRTGMISTVNAVIGDRAMETGLHTTTPDADETQDYLAQMRDAGLTDCVLEVTSHALAHHRVDGIPFAVAAVTNITHEHLDLHGTREAYRAAKGRLFEMAATAVLNVDDPFSYDYLRGLIRDRRVLSYSRAEPADIRAVGIQHAADGLHLDVDTPAGRLSLTSRLIGDYNVSNILAAVGIGVALGVPGEAIASGVAAMQGVPGRMERIDAGQPYLAVVDFAHTPNALASCLRALKAITPGRLIVVFGCAGERDREKRPLMGRAAAEGADVVVLTAEDPRRESLEAILDAVEAGARAAESRAILTRVPDRGEALAHACKIARPGDTVVACGKGHEQSMCFGVTERPWDDRVALRAAIEAALGAT
ncbi:MAG TPA: UDP-N-acetylmuramoyl-L-alanyl-D-glutamate--2,6-diaminopimelate ligase [Thermoflexales bacterium]|nr:UDP-N-acetylmuramoyl-L-alanyl-D-glutamate--2,6-diaminopimelate ligase [Thermoflexales bacterium]